MPWEAGTSTGHRPLSAHRQRRQPQPHRPPGWWGDSGSLPVREIRLASLTKPDELVSAFNSGEVSLIDVDLTGTSELGSSGSYQVWDYPSTDLLYLGFNASQGLCQDPEIRRAMDIATIGAKTLKKRGMLPELDESEEINACSIHVTAQVDGQAQDWLLMFKNETHNHPTEIEPFGGAATCIGGCIRDPLSGRVYVHQAMRVTGCGDPPGAL